MLECNKLKPSELHLDHLHLLTLNCVKAFPNASTVSTSKWLVGSSRIRKLGLQKNKNQLSHAFTKHIYKISVNFFYTNLFAAIRANANLLFCPPESEATGRNASSPVTP